MALTSTEDEQRTGDLSNFHHNQASGDARQHNGHNYFNNNFYTSPRSDRTLPEAECNPAFWEAVTAGHLPRANHLLGVGANLDARDTKGRDALHLAATYGRTDMARFLLRMGADVDSSVGHRGIVATALTAASSQGNEEMVQILLEYKADPNGKKVNAISPLHAACMSKSPEVVRRLLENGASPLQSSIGPIYESDELIMSPRQSRNEGEDMIANNQGQVMRGLPLHAAILRGDLQCVKMLLESDKTCAQVQIEIWGGVDWGTDTDVIETIDRKPDVVSPCLHLALRVCTSVDILGLLVDSGLDVDHQSANGWTALHVAACDDDRSGLLRKLIDCGASLKLRNKDNKRALRLALEGDQSECLAAFIDCGIGLDYRNDADDTLLHLAALYNSIECGRLLIKLGIDINVSRKRGTNALHVALREGNDDMARYLLDHGASVEALDERGNSPLHVAALWGRVHSVQLLLDLGACVNESSGQYKAAHYAARNGHASILRLLIDKTTDFDPQERFDGMTLLTNAVYTGRNEVVEILLDAGADPRRTDPSGWSAIQLARRLNIPKVNEMMRKRGLLPEQVKVKSPKEKRNGSGSTKLDGLSEENSRRSPRTPTMEHRSPSYKVSYKTTGSGQS